MPLWDLLKTQYGTKLKYVILNHIMIYVSNQQLLSLIFDIVVIITISFWYFSFLFWTVQESFNYTEVTGDVQRTALLKCCVISSVFFGCSRSDHIICTRCIGTMKRKWGLYFQKYIYSQLMGIINAFNLVDFDIVIPIKYLITLVSSILFGGRGNFLPIMEHKVSINWVDMMTSWSLILWQ